MTPTDTLASHPSGSIVKMLNIGESSTGKTGALASLASAGYNLYILDYDNGLDIVANILRSSPAALDRVHYRTLRDKIAMDSGGVPKVVPSGVHAYKAAGEVLNEWNRKPLGPQDIIVLDTLTTFSDSAFNEALKIGGRLNQRPQLQDYGWMADSVKLFVEMITDPELLPCHVIVNTHVRYFAADEESQTQPRGLPNARGQEISRVVSRYFNTVVLTRTMGAGPGARRVITTQPQGVVEVKTSAPTSVKASYPIDTGLAALFQDILGHGPTGPASTSNQPTTKQTQPELTSNG